MKQIIIFFCFSYTLLFNSCIISKPPSYCLPPKTIHLGTVKLLKIRKFVNQQEGISNHKKKYNIIKEYCFDKEATNDKNVGLFSIERRNVSHRFKHYFINGSQRITPLVFPNTFLSKEQDSIQSKLILEKALAKHSKEISDSLRFRIQQVFYFSRQ